MKENPLVLEISARILVQQSSEQLGKSVYLDAVPDTLLKQWAEQGFDAIWIMGIWTTGEAGREVSLKLSDNYTNVLPDWQPQDVSGSPYAIRDYRVHPEFGGDESLAILRDRLASNGLSLILDFVPNHTAPDHAWVTDSPHYYIEGTEQLLTDQPHNYCRIGDRILTFGRDPYFSGWADTLQLDYRVPEIRETMIDTLVSIAEKCDAVRCDMAMLVLSDVFIKTWGSRDDAEFGEREFWADAIDTVRRQHPDFKFIAEAYWGLEERLQHLGFDYTYNKSAYDHIKEGQTDAVKQALRNTHAAERSVFFIENHDEPRAKITFAKTQSRHNAAFLVLTLPGLRLIHDGQIQARETHHSVHLARRKHEPPNNAEIEYYHHLFEALDKSCVGKGSWQALSVQPTLENNHNQLAASLWQHSDTDDKNLVLINFSDTPSEGYIEVKFFEVGGRQWILTDLLSDQCYERDGTGMSSPPGLYVRLNAYQRQIFTITAKK